MIFADTSGLVASIAPLDPYHQRARAWLLAERRHLLVTDYVMSEAMTLLRARGADRLAIAFGSRLLAGEVGVLHQVTVEEKAAAFDVFRRYSDKEWSFTDCTSKVVMERLGITTAFTFDHHFRQFGSVDVVP